MAQSRTLKNSLDDALLALRITDFSGGLNSEMDPLDLPENASPDCENVKVNKPGRLIGRDGYLQQIAGLDEKPDGIAFFYDALGARRLVLWQNGNMYDVTAHALTLIKSGAYTAGFRVTSHPLNGILYYSDGHTIHGGTSGIRQWDGATEQALISAGGVGIIETPAAKVLTSYAGSLVLGSITFVDGTTAKHAVMWSDVNDPTTIRGTSIQQVGQGFGGEVNCVLPLGVASTGVSPFRALIVGKSEFGLYGYSGALGALEEFLVNCPAGVRDGETMRYIPGPDGSGYVVFLGTDNKVWAVNGTSAVELSGNIRSELNRSIQSRVIANSMQRFTSVVNSNDFQYVLDLGDMQYCYHYDQKAWTRYRGWPSGHWVEGRDSFGNCALYCADRVAKSLAQCNVGTTDNGTAIAPYWRTPCLHAGDRNILKTWHWVYAMFRTDSGNVTISCVPNLGNGTASFKTLSTSSDDSAGDLIWDEGSWDEKNWASSSLDGYQNYRKKARLTYQPENVPYKDLIRGADVTIQISTSSNTGHFEVLGITLLYLPRGRQRVAPL